MPGFLICLLVRNDRVSQAKCLDKTLNIRIVLMCNILYVPIKLFIFKVDIRDAQRILYLLLWLVLTVGEIVNRELLKLHNVLSERTCLVTKDLLDHSELFI